MTARLSSVVMSACRELKSRLRNLTSARTVLTFVGRVCSLVHLRVLRLRLLVHGSIPNHPLP